MVLGFPRGPQSPIMRSTPTPKVFFVGPKSNASIFAIRVVYDGPYRGFT